MSILKKTEWNNNFFFYFKKSKTCFHESEIIFSGITSLNFFQKDNDLKLFKKLMYWKNYYFKF